MFFYSGDPHIINSFILYTKIYILVTHFYIRYSFVYRICNALYLLKIFFSDFIYNRKIGRRINFQIRSYRVKNRLITLHFLFRLRYEILKR